MNSLNFILSVIKSNFNYNDGSKIVEDLKKETCDLNDKINEIVINFFKFYSEKNIIIDESPEPNKNPLFSLGNIQKKLRSTEYSQYQIKILNFVCHSIIKNKLNLSLENEINSIFLASTQMIGSSKIYSRSNKLREEILQPFF